MLALGAGACERPAQLIGALTSADAVAGAVVRALNDRDSAALESLALSESEFRHVVWPRLPAARPERNLPWDYVWNDLASKSRLQLRARLDAWRSTPYEVVSVRFDGPTTEYGSYRVHRDARVELRTAEGRLLSARLFGSIIEHDGQFKVFSYIVD